MSSDDDLHEIDDGSIPGFSHAVGSADSAKRRKVLRACDVCRRKKIRCDAHSQPNIKCTHCVTYKLDCTFIEGAKKRGPPKGYIDDLEKRCQLLERLVLRLSPTIDLESEVGPSFTKDTWAVVRGAANHGRGSRSLAPIKSAGLPSALPPSPTLSPSNCPVNRIGFPKDPSAIPPEVTLNVTSNLNSDDEANYTSSTGCLTKHIESGMEELDLAGFETRFHGKSSGVSLVQVAMNLKEEVTGSGLNTKRMINLRPKFWKPNPWEWMTSSLPSLEHIVFPPEDLADKLIELCFEHVLIVFPVIHKPWFTRQRKMGLHRRDVNFCRIYLLVCAVGSRYTDDERVCVKNPSTGDIEWTSAGWTYFAQVMSMKRPILAPARLSDLQTTALSSLYLQGTSAPHAAWLLTGIGLRFAQDIGAHREKVYGADHPFENQMWKRAFWCLVALDRITSSGLGRPIGVFDEDIDADLPLEVDDEYYDEATKEWKQPEGKPAHLMCFNHYVKLMGILAYAIRTVYSINKSKVHLGFVGPEWESHTVAELDSALNSWLDSIPDHLKWDPNIKDDAHFQQAAMLRFTFHYVQITIHRPFIPVLAANGKASPLSFPSLAICTNAARSVSHILEAYAKRSDVAWPLTYIVAFTAGTVLLISIWGVKKNGLNVDVSSQIADVHRCLQYLHRAEKRWHTAGRLYDILKELATVNDLPLPQTTPTPPDTTRKREREDETDMSDTTSPGRAPSVPYPEVTNRTPSSTSTAATAFGAPSPTFLPHSTGATFPYPPFFTSPPLSSHSPQSRHVSGSTVSGGGRTPTQTPSLNFDPKSSQFSDVPLPSWGSTNPSGVPLQSSLFDTSWENYHIAGCAIPGMNTSLSRMTGLSLPPVGPGQADGPAPALSPDSFFQELLGTFNNPSGGIQAAGAIGVAAATAAPTGIGDELWSSNGTNEWSWMNDIGMFGVTPSSAPGPSQ